MGLKESGFPWKLIRPGRGKLAIPNHFRQHSWTCTFLDVRNILCITRLCYSERGDSSRPPIPKNMLEPDLWINSWEADCMKRQPAWEREGPTAAPLAQISPVSAVLVCCAEPAQRYCCATVVAETPSCHFRERVHHQFRYRTCSTALGASRPSASCSGSRTTWLSPGPEKSHPPGGSASRCGPVCTHRCYGRITAGEHSSDMGPAKGNDETVVYALRFARAMCSQHSRQGIREGISQVSWSLISATNINISLPLSVPPGIFKGWSV